MDIKSGNVAINTDYTFAIASFPLNRLNGSSFVIFFLSPGCFECFAVWRTPDSAAIEIESPVFSGEPATAAHSRFPTGAAALEGRDGHRQNMQG